MKAYIVTEGEFSATLLAKLLADEVQLDTHIVSASGKSDAQSLARSLVAARRRPVALVLDANTSEDGLVAEQRLVSRELLAMASPGIPIEVFMAVPSIERLFFAEPELLGRLLGHTLSDVERVEGRFAPRAVLGRLLKGPTKVRSMSELLAALTEDDAAQMCKHTPVAEIKEFLRDKALAGVAEGSS